MIFLKGKDWDESWKTIIINLRYIVKIWDTENRRKVGVTYTYLRDYNSIYLDRNTMKFIEAKTPEDTDGFLQEEDMRVE